jgi:hypothetical protein
MHIRQKIPKFSYKSKFFMIESLAQPLSTSSIAEKLAGRAFRAVEGLLFTKAKKVRYKSKNQFKTIEGKNNTEGLMWKETGLKNLRVATFCCFHPPLCRRSYTLPGNKSRYLFSLICVFFSEKLRFSSYPSMEQ